MALRLSALAEQNMKKILNNINKKGGRRVHRRRNLLMSDDENASVSEYEPPAVTRLPRKKRFLSDEDGPSTSKIKTKRGKKRVRRRLTATDEEESLNYSSNNPSTSYSRGFKRTSGRNYKLACDKSNNSESDEDYNPSRTPFSAVNNGYSKKFKPKNQLKGSKLLVIKEKRKNNTTVEESGATVSSSVYSELITDMLFNGPSTSTAAHLSLPVDKVQTVHVSKNSSDEDENSDDNISPKNVSISYNGKPNSKLLSSNSGSGEEKESEEDKSSDESDSESQKDAEKDHDSDEQTDKENQENSDDSFSKSESDASSNKQKTKKKTIKCLYPKRLKTSESNGKHLKLRSNYSKLNNNDSLKVNGRTRNLGRIPGKYPLRPITKKNLAEVSSDESNDDEIIAYSPVTRRRRPQNGVSLCVENSDESDNDDDENVDVSDNDSDNYLPPAMTSRGRKRRRSSDATDCSFRPRPSKQLTSGSDQGRRKSLRARKCVRNNSDSEVSQESNNSDSDSKPAKISVSSRGRVRKLTPRARAFLGD